MSDNRDFRGPIGRVVQVTPQVQESGILLAMLVQYPPAVETNPPSAEAVLLPLDLASELSEELSDAVIHWRETHIRTDP